MSTTELDRLAAELQAEYGHLLPPTLIATTVAQAGALGGARAESTARADLEGLAGASLRRESAAALP